MEWYGWHVAINSIGIIWGKETVYDHGIFTLPITMKTFLAGVTCRASMNYTGGQTNFHCGIPSLSQVNLYTGGGAAWELMTYIILAVL